MNTSETASSSDPERPYFENLKYDIVDNSEDILLDNSCDPDVNFFSLKTQNLDTPYIYYRKNFKNSLVVLLMIHFQYFI